MVACPECSGLKWGGRSAYEPGLCATHRAQVVESHRRRGQAIREARAASRRTNAEIDWRNWAIRSVARAVRNGWLPDLSTGEYACVDCDGIADRWEHRDYAHVLDVEPVCHACNMRRGLGRMPVFHRVFARHPSAQASGESERSSGNRAA